jgi:hypothetical protein
MLHCVAILLSFPLGIFKQFHSGEKMMSRLLVVTSIILLTIAMPTMACDCKMYPFTPNPPCFKECTKKIATGSLNLESVENMDVQSRATFERLRRSSIPMSAIDNLDDEASLQAALKRYESKKSDLDGYR